MRNSALIVLTLGLPLGAGMAQSAVILPGQTVVPDSQTETGMVVNSRVSRFQIGQDIGFLQSSVYLEPAGNLDFVYQLSNFTDTSPLVGVTFSDFSNLMVNVGYEPGTGFLSPGVPGDFPPTSANRSTIGDVLEVNFLGSNALQAGESSDLLIVRTNAIGYFTYFTIGGTVTDAAGDQSVGVPFFGPIPVPEPSSGSMAVVGILSLVIVVWLRRRIATGVGFRRKPAWGGLP